MSDSGAAQRRGVRTYVLRQGRLTAAQRRAVDQLLPRYGLPATPGPLHPPAVFGRRAPLWLELGFGNGETLAELAAVRPGTDFIGAEVHLPGVGHLLLEIERLELANLRVWHGDGLELLRQRIGPATLDRVLVLFPDPWHKKRHHKRRLVQAGFLDLLAGRLRPGGRLHLATDWADYGEQLRIARPAPGPRGARPGLPPQRRSRRRFSRRRINSAAVAIMRL